jgi:hypothetical protein
MSAANNPNCPACGNAGCHSNTGHIKGKPLTRKCQGKRPANTTRPKTPNALAHNSATGSANLG